VVMVVRVAFRFNDTVVPHSADQGFLHVRQNRVQAFLLLAVRTCPAVSVYAVVGIGGCSTVLIVRGRFLPVGQTSGK